MVYTDWATLPTEATTGYNFGTAQTFYLNGLYSPGPGRQPYGFDQFCPTLYKRFKVYRCKVSLQFFNPSLDGIVVAASVAPPGATHALAGLTLDEVMQYPFTCVKHVSDSGKQAVNMWFDLDIGEISGLTREQFIADPDGYTGSGTGNPGTLPELRIAAASSSGTEGNIQFRIKMEFWSMFYERVQLGNS